MEGEEEKNKRASSNNGTMEMETLILKKVAEVSSATDSAKSADVVIVALHSLAVCLFPVDSSTLAGFLNENYRSQVLDARLHVVLERDDWRNVFYNGAAFPTMTKILIYNVGSKWLVHFPLSVRKQVYDSFFVKGPPIEIVQTLVPALVHIGAGEEFDSDAISSNIERLLVLCLLENEVVRHIVAKFEFPCRVYGHAGEIVKPDKLKFISRAAQLLASIPDKARPKGPSALSSQYPHISCRGRCFGCVHIKF